MMDRWLLSPIQHLLKLFDRIVVAVAANPGKEPMFSLDERVELVRNVLSDLDNVEVTGYTGLTIEFAQQHDLEVIVRGLRAVSDFEYEFQMAGMNDRLNPNIETVFLMADPQYQTIASRLVKEIARMGGDVSQFVTPEVELRLKDKYT